MTRLPENLTFVVVKAHQKPDESQCVWHVLLLTLRCIALLKGNALIWNDLTNLWFSIHRVTFQVLERTKPNLITCLEKFWMTVVGLIYRFLSPCSKDCSSKSQCLMTLLAASWRDFCLFPCPGLDLRWMKTSRTDVAGSLWVPMKLLVCLVGRMAGVYCGV